MTTVLDFAVQYAQLGLELGCTPLKDVEVKVLGSTVQGPLSAPQRKVVVAYDAPRIYDGMSKIWVNPLDNTVFMVDQENNVWDRVESDLEVSALFASIKWEGSGKGTAGGTSGFKYKPNTRTELKAIQTSVLEDKDLAYVEGDRCIYAYDTSYNLPADSATAVATNEGIGQWLIITQAGELGVLDAGIF